jgi:hypothetical protein
MSNLIVGQLQGLPANNFRISLASGSSLSIPGSIVQVGVANTGFVNQTITSATPQQITGLSISITPRSSANLIIVDSVISASWSHVASAHVFKDGVNVTPAHGGNNQSGGTNAIWTHYASAFGTSADKVMPFPLQWYEVSGSTATRTYSIRANSGWAGGADSLFINNRNSLDMLGSSWMRVMEVAQ